MEESKVLAKNREYWSFIGSYKGVELIVSSMGIGSPSTAIGVEEFGMCGVDTFIRVGTSGSLNKNVPVGSIVNSIGAIRDEGTSKQYIPIEYPALATADVILALREDAKINKIKNYFEGLVHSKDSFYMEYPEYTAHEEFTKSNWNTWIKGNVLRQKWNVLLFLFLHS